MVHQHVILITFSELGVELNVEQLLVDDKKNPQQPQSILTPPISSNQNHLNPEHVVITNTDLVGMNVKAA